jgi:hypothetical protein
VGPSHLFPKKIFNIGIVYLHYKMQAWYENTCFSLKFQKKKKQIKKYSHFKNIKNMFFFVHTAKSLKKNNKNHILKKLKLYGKF